MYLNWLLLLLLIYPNTENVIYGYEQGKFFHQETNKSTMVLLAMCYGSRYIIEQNDNLNEELFHKTSNSDESLNLLNIDEKNSEPSEFLNKEPDNDKQEDKPVVLDENSISSSSEKTEVDNNISSNKKVANNGSRNSKLNKIKVEGGSVKRKNSQQYKTGQNFKITNYNQQNSPLASRNNQQNTTQVSGSEQIFQELIFLGKEEDSNSNNTIENYLDNIATKLFDSPNNISANKKQSTDSHSLANVSSPKNTNKNNSATDPLNYLYYNNSSSAKKLDSPHNNDDPESFIDNASILTKELTPPPKNEEYKDPSSLNKTTEFFSYYQPFASPNNEKNKGSSNLNETTGISVDNSSTQSNNNETLDNDNTSSLVKKSDLHDNYDDSESSIYNNSNSSESDASPKVKIKDKKSMIRIIGNGFVEGKIPTQEQKLVKLYNEARVTSISEEKLQKLVFKEVTFSGKKDSNSKNTIETPSNNKATGNPLANVSSSKNTTKNNSATSTINLDNNKVAENYYNNSSSAEELDSHNNNNASKNSIDNALILAKKLKSPNNEEHKDSLSLNKTNENSLFYPSKWGESFASSNNGTPTDSSNLNETNENSLFYPSKWGESFASSNNENPTDFSNLNETKEVFLYDSSKWDKSFASPNNEKPIDFSSLENFPAAASILAKELTPATNEEPEKLTPFKNNSPGHFLSGSSNLIESSASINVTEKKKRKRNDGQEEQSAEIIQISNKKLAYDIIDYNDSLNRKAEKVDQEEDQEEDQKNMSSLIAQSANHQKDTNKSPLRQIEKQSNSKKEKSSKPIRIVRRIFKQLSKIIISSSQDVYDAIKPKSIKQKNNQNSKNNTVAHNPNVTHYYINNSNQATNQYNFDEKERQTENFNITQYPSIQKQSLWQDLKEDDQINIYPFSNNQEYTIHSENPGAIDEVKFQGEKNPTLNRNNVIETKKLGSPNNKSPNNKSNNAFISTESSFNSPKVNRHEKEEQRHKNVRIRKILRYTPTKHNYTPNKGKNKKNINQENSQNNTNNFLNNRHAINNSEQPTQYEQNDISNDFKLLIEEAANNKSTIEKLQNEISEQVNNLKIKLLIEYENKDQKELNEDMLRICKTISIKVEILNRLLKRFNQILNAQNDDDDNIKQIFYDITTSIFINGNAQNLKKFLGGFLIDEKQNKIKSADKITVEIDSRTNNIEFIKKIINEQHIIIESYGIALELAHKFNTIVSEALINQERGTEKLGYEKDCRQISLETLEKLKKLNFEEEDKENSNIKMVEYQDTQSNIRATKSENLVIQDLNFEEKNPQRKINNNEQAANLINHPTKAKLDVEDEDEKKENSKPENKIASNGQSAKLKDNQDSFEKLKSIANNNIKKIDYICKLIENTETLLKKAEKKVKSIKNTDQKELIEETKEEIGKIWMHNLDTENTTENVSNLKEIINKVNFLKSMLNVAKTRQNQKTIKQIIVRQNNIIESNTFKIDQAKLGYLLKDLDFLLDCEIIETFSFNQFFVKYRNEEYRMDLDCSLTGTSKFKLTQSKDEA